MSDVVLDRVSKHFGETTAVDDVSLEITDGEFMVLLGPSGCGKTTLLRIIAGLETVSEGTVSIGGNRVDDVDPKDRNVSMVFQSYALYPHMTVSQNIESPLVARKVPKERRRAMVDEVAESLGLEDLLSRKPAALSGGQRQRVALARAIVSRPDVYLMDEPLSNLDAALRTRTRLELVELHRRVDTTFVYVTHDQVDAMTMATRIAIMDNGVIQQVGPPQAVYEHPHNLFVARFIGSPPMNTIDGRFVLDGGLPFVRVPGGRFAASGITTETVVDGTGVVVGVRPEHLEIGDGPVSATIRSVEWLGHERHVTCDLGTTEVIVRQATRDPGPDVGDRVELNADPANVHLFDPSTTVRLA